MEFITTNRGARFVIKNQYLFYKNKTGNNGNSYWECSERRNGNGCHARISLDENDELLTETEHTHPPNPDEVAARKVKLNMKRDARLSNATTNTIIAANVAGASDGTLAKIPKQVTIYDLFENIYVYIRDKIFNGK